MNAKQRSHRVRPLQLLPLLLSLVACTGDDVPGLSAAILALTGAS